MKFIKKFDQYISAVFIITIIVIIATSYFTFKEFFASNNQRQQEVIMPLFSLITSEIVRPLTVSQYMASDPFLIDYIQQDKIEKTVVFNYISSVANRFNTMAFIAIEKHQLLIDSNNKTTNLSGQNAEWFYRLKAIDKHNFTDFGDAEDPHLFFDVKMVNNQGEFLGFVGLGIDLDYFSKKFTSFKKDFGFELYFVDENNNITLSSSQLMKTGSHHRQEELVKIDELDWYKHYQQHQKPNHDTPAQYGIFSSTSDELIVSQMLLKEVNWRVFIIAPPANKQKAYWLLFIPKLVIFLVVSLALYYIFILCIGNLKSNLVKDSETDYLTQLPNRGYIHWKYSQLSQQHDHVSIVIADIDNFKSVNDTYGHLFGDDVLKVIAKKLHENLRSIDLTGRWGGEEFILVLPDTTAEQAQEIIDRIRTNIANIPFSPSSTSKKFNVTVSFGISESSLADVPLQDILAKADQALYCAKANGRNQVVIHLE